MSEPLDLIITQLEVDPKLSVCQAAQHHNINKSVLSRQLKRIGRDDLVQRFSERNKNSTYQKYQAMFALLDADSKLIVRDTAQQVGLHWNGTHVRKKLIELNRNDLLPRITPTEFRVTQNVENLRQLLDSDKDLSVKQAAERLGMCVDVAARQLRARNQEGYINRQLKRNQKSREAKAARLVKKLRTDPNASARQLASQAGLRHEDFLSYLKDHGHDELIKSRNPYDEAFIAQVRDFVKNNPKASCRAVANKFKLSAQTVKRWCSPTFDDKQSYTAEQKQEIINSAVQQLEGDPALSLSKLAKLLPISFSCLRKWLLGAGRKDLVQRHRKVECLKIDYDIVADFDHPQFTVALAAQKYGVAPRTIIERLLAAGRKDCLNRKAAYDYSKFEIGECYKLGENIYIASLKCLVTYTKDKIQEGLPLRDVYEHLEEITAKDVAIAWNFERVSDLDNLLKAYMSDFYSTVEAA